MSTDISVYASEFMKIFIFTEGGGLKVILISVARETNNILTCPGPRLRGEINVAKQGRVSHWDFYWGRPEAHSHSAAQIQKWLVARP